METVAASWSPHKVDLESGVLTRRGFVSNSPLHESNFDIGRVRKAFGWVARLDLPGCATD